jgi:hypothetical protein
MAEGNMESPYKPFESNSEKLDINIYSEGDKNPSDQGTASSCHVKRKERTGIWHCQARGNQRA